MATMQVSRDAGKGMSFLMRTITEMPNCTGTTLAEMLVKQMGPLEEKAPLTNREREVVGLISEAMPNRCIMNTLRISECTVKHHLRHIYSKLDIKGTNKEGKRITLLLLARLNPTMISSDGKISSHMQA
jgi:DNA-binding CsgD family transcriptional regulator